MENTYSFNSYPDSGESSPRSREIDFDNPTPWEDQAQQPQSYKAKFMCSYGGKIHPRPHDNQLAYIGGETKILAVDRNIKFSVMISKLAAVCGDTDVAFKYQLPGEDLDALISVTNDDDLEHMMHEYDRLYRGSAKPARMRLFLFPVSPSPASFGSDGGKSDRERFVEALNSGPSLVVESTKAAANNVDFLFGLDKGAPPPPPPVKVPDLPEIHAVSGHDDRAIGSDPLNLQAQLQRMQIREHEQPIGYNRKNSDENLVGGYTAAGGDFYVQKVPEKVPQANLPVTMPPQVTAPPGYWPDKQATGGGFPVAVTTAPGQMEQPVYMIPGPAPGTVYHAPPPVMRQVTGQTGQGYYMQRMGGPGHGPDVYREQPVYNMVPQHQQPPPPMGPMGVVRPSGPGVAVTDAGYAQVAYDNAVGRQVYYTAPGGVVHQQQQQQQQQQQPPLQYQGVGGGEMRHVGGGEMRHVGGGGPLGPETKVVTTKVSQASV